MLIQTVIIVDLMAMGMFFCAAFFEKINYWKVVNGKQFKGSADILVATEYSAIAAITFMKPIFTKEKEPHAEICRKKVNQKLLFGYVFFFLIFLIGHLHDATI